MPKATYETEYRAAVRLLRMVRDDCEVLNPNGTRNPISQPVLEEIEKYLDSDAVDH